VIDALTLFGVVAVSAMLASYALEQRSHIFVAMFAAASLAASAYGFAQGAWPFGAVELVWSAVALRRWQRRLQRERPTPRSASTTSA
jgi:hypothetical protein